MALPTLRTKEAVLDWFEGNGYSKFTLYRTHTNSATNRIYNQSEEMTLEQAKAKLDTVLGWYDNKGDFYLFVTDSKNGTGGGYQTLVSIDKSSNSNNNVNGINGIPEGYLSASQVQGMIENTMLKMQLQQMQEKISGLESGGGGRQLSAWENMMEGVLQDEGSGKEIAVGLRDMFRGFGMAAHKVAGGVFEGKGGAKRLPTGRATEKAKNTEGVKLEQKDMDGRKLMVLFPKMKNEFPDAAPQNLIAAIWDFYAEADEMTRMVLKEKLQPLIEKHENIASPTLQKEPQTEGTQEEEQN